MPFRTPSYYPGVSTFIQLSDVPSSYSGQGGKYLRVKVGEDGLEFVTISAGGLTVLSTASTIDDSNTQFVFASEPTVLVINGQAHTTSSTVGGQLVWSWDGGTLTATVLAPVGTGGSIFGLS